MKRGTRLSGEDNVEEAQTNLGMEMNIESRL
jgi:hypothetical protein